MVPLLEYTNHINNKKHVHHGFLGPRPYLCSTSLKLIVCFSSRFFKNPMRKCENKTHSNCRVCFWSKQCESYTCVDAKHTINFKQPYNMYKLLHEGFCNKGFIGRDQPLSPEQCEGDKSQSNPINHLGGGH